MALVGRTYCLCQQLHTLDSLSSRCRRAVLVWNSPETQKRANENVGTRGDLVESSRVRQSRRLERTYAAMSSEGKQTKRMVYVGTLLADYPQHGCGLPLIPALVGISPPTHSTRCITQALLSCVDAGRPMQVVWPTK